MTKLAIFDFDGTLVDTRAKVRDLMLAYFDMNKLPRPNADLYLDNYNKPGEMDYGWGIPIEDQTSFCVKMFAWINPVMVRDKNDPPPMFEGIKEWLHSLHDEGIHLAIATSRNEESTLHMLEHHGVAKMFRTIRSEDDIVRRGHRHKPYPDKLLCVMKELGFHANDCVMIGDTTMDVEAGLAAQTSTLGVSWGYHERPRLVKAGAHVIVDKGDEAHPAFVSLINRP